MKSKLPKQQLLMESQCLSDDGEASSSNNTVNNPNEETNGSSRDNDEMGKMKIVVHEPGLVQIQGALSSSEQNELATLVLAEGEASTQGNERGGFWEINDGGHRVLNSTKWRGRKFDAIDKLNHPELTDFLLSHSKRLHELAREADPVMPQVIPSTHALLLYYSSKSHGIGEHRDNGTNDGAGLQPVISFNLLRTVEFSVRHEKSHPKQIIMLEPGDVILFGGPCRHILHSISKIHSRNDDPLEITAKTTSSTEPSPSLLSSHQNARLNVTLRYAPEILGREEEFKYFKPTPGYNAKKKERNQHCEQQRGGRKHQSRWWTRRKNGKK